MITTQDQMESGCPGFLHYRPRNNPLLFLCLLIISGCQGPYEVTLNDRMVYDPFQRERNYTLEDANLQGCLNQQMGSNEEVPLDDITLMACPASGIVSLQGIDALPNLEQLELSDNAITNLGPIAQLDRLRVLSIRDNNIRDIRPLIGQQLLRFVSLQGNSDIPCRQLDQLEERIGNGLNRPISCVN